MTDTFTRNIAGRDIEFKSIKPGQLQALRRYQQSAVKAVGKIKKNDLLSKEEQFTQLAELSEAFDLKMLRFIESLLINEDDTDFLIDVQISGDADVAELLATVLGNTELPDDDEDPAPVAVKKPPNPLKKATAAKKTANARRTKR
jgi:hypothetical protein